MGVTLCDELDHAARHLDEHTLDDVARVDALVLAHVLLGVVLAVTGVVGVDVLTNVD